MAGNDTDARRRAEDAYRSAKSANAPQKTTDKLFAEYAAAQAADNASCGTSHQARR